MSYSLVFGISLHSGALVQELDITDKSEIVKIYGMDSGTSKPQVKKVYDYGQELSGSVKGHGSLTMVSGVGGAIGLTGVSGGISFIEEVKYTEGITKPSEWEYKWYNFPYAA